MFVVVHLKIQEFSSFDVLCVDQFLILARKNCRAFFLLCSLVGGEGGEGEEGEGPDPRGQREPLQQLYD